ncbi:hypothetical protein HRbin15_02361 [bacterium HR15]|nr:hypothetical protein HRbin15_02361 [bacterium HR15]
MRTMSKGIATLLNGLVMGALLNAQHRFDDFQGGLRQELAWSWQVPGNTPLNSYAPERVHFTDDWLRIEAQPGTLYERFNTIRNLPSLPVPALRGAWLIETRVRLERGGQSGSYLQAGLVLFQDADHYFNLHLVYDPAQGHWLRVSAGHEWDGTYQWAGLTTALWSPSEGNTVRLQIRYDPATEQVAFFYDRENSAFWQPLNGSPRSLHDLPALQAVATQGGRIGLYVDTAGWQGSPPPVAWFDYLEIDNAPHPADINADGWVDDADLLTVLFALGEMGCHRPADINHDGQVDDADLLTVLFAFGES